MASTSNTEKRRTKQTEQNFVFIFYRVLLAPVAPAHLHAVEFEIEALDGLQAIAGLDVLGIAQHADVDGDLEVILLLADKGVVGQGEVEALVGVHAVCRHWTLRRQRERDRRG